MESNEDYTKRVYRERRIALDNVKEFFANNGRRIAEIPSKDKRTLASDFYLDGKLCKFKTAIKPQTHVLFEMYNGGKVSWMVKSKAKLYLFNVIADKIMYVIDKKGVIKYILDESNFVEKKRTGRSFEKDPSWSYMISLDELRDAGLILEEIDYYVG